MFLAYNRAHGYGYTEAPHTKFGDIHGFNVDQLLKEVGLADSVTDGRRKRRARSVYINGTLVKSHDFKYAVAGLTGSGPWELLIQVGRQSKKIVVTP